MNDVIYDKTTFVFLDLEETVIQDWSSLEALTANILKIERYLNGYDIVIPPLKKGGEETISPATPILNLRLGLMSWAVWNDIDKQRFKAKIQPWLEPLIKRQFDEDLIFSMTDWARLVREATGKQLSQDDMFDLFGKPEVLWTLMCKHKMFYHSTVWLVDDAYEHMLNARSFENDCILQFQNINRMN